MREDYKTKSLSAPEPADAQVRKNSIENNIREILSFIGDNPDREGLLETPRRVVKSWERLFGGYKQNPESVLKTFVEGSCDEMVVLKDIEFYSTCEHHLQPFFGTISIGYLPNKRVLGVSKLARLVEIYSRRLQIQEKLSAEIADNLMKYLNPLGVMVVCKARHLCVSSRGVEKHNAVMVTSAIRGVFKRPEVRAEFLDFIK